MKWDSYSGSQYCYKILDEPKNWYEAREACRGYGSDLLYFEDNFEFDYLKSIILNDIHSREKVDPVSLRYYLDLHRYLFEDGWSWGNGHSKNPLRRIPKYTSSGCPDMNCGRIVFNAPATFIIWDNFCNGDGECLVFVRKLVALLTVPFKLLKCQL